MCHHQGKENGRGGRHDDVTGTCLFMLEHDSAIILEFLKNNDHYFYTC